MYSADSSEAIESHNPVATNSVFPRVTNNYSTCHQPRLIPQYMNLHDLKFRVCKPDNVQVYFTYVGESIIIINY